MRESVRASLLLGALAAAAVTVGCGRPGAYRAKSLKSVSGLSYSWVRTNLFAPRCFGCHGGAGGAAGIDLSSHAALISSGAIVPFDPGKSRVVQAVDSDRMPKGGPAVADDLKSALSTWILAGAPESTTGNEEESPASVPLPTTPPIPPGSVGPRGSFSFLLVNVLYPKCIGCHGGAFPSAGINLGSYAGVMASNVVVANSTATSRLFAVTSSGLMPRGGTPLDATEMAAISEWIMAGATDDGVAAPGPAPSPLPPLAPTYSSLRANVFQPRCVGCHSGPTPSNGLDLSTYARILSEGEVVAPGNAGLSKLYQVVSSGEMPQGGPSLPAAQVTAIRDWINAGALNN